MRSVRLLVLLALTTVYVVAAPAQQDVKLLVHGNANLRASSSTQSAIKDHLEPGDEVTRILPTKQNGFWKVRTATNIEGWIYQTLVHVVEIDEVPATPTPAAAATLFDPTWPKPAPVGSILQGLNGLTCPADGEPGGDLDTNRRKNRMDTPAAYQEVTFDALAGLSFPDAPINRNNWTLAQKDAIAPFEGVAVSVVGFIVAVKKQSGGSGEATNCHFNTVNLVDVHVASVENPGESEEKSIVVEPTPRFYGAHPTWVWSKLNDLDDSPDPVRVSRWVLYDPSHKNHLGTFRATLWRFIRSRRLRCSNMGSGRCGESTAGLRSVDIAIDLYISISIAMVTYLVLISFLYLT